jgi:tetratricopeptide (TPR) repeat protein
MTTSADVQRIIEDARDAELCRNLDLFRAILSAFWENTDHEPNVASFEPHDRAELLRSCGVFLSQFGRARGLPDYQLRAKDILTRAAEMFEDAQRPDKAAEAKVCLANCFWFLGEIAEYDDILQAVEAEFDEKPEHPVSIQIRLNRLLVAVSRGQAEEAIRLVDEISRLISSDHDFRLRTQFHNLAGIACRVAGDLERAALHAKEAVQIAREAGNPMFVALSLNNLAFVYRTAGEYDLAHETVDESIAIMESHLDRGWVAHALDTKALILMDQGECENALEVIERSLGIFEEGEDYAGLADAMWNKCACLLRLGRKHEAIVLYGEVHNVAAQKIGRVAVDKFASRFAEEVYLLKHLPLTEEVAAFKRSQVVKVMRELGGHVGEAARRLGLKSQQHLSDILLNQFPDIYDELGLKRRARRSDANVPKKPAPASMPGVTRLIMPKTAAYSFNFAWPAKSDPEFYYFPLDLMKEFGIKTDAVVAVMQASPESLSNGTAVLYMKGDKFRVGRLSFDEFTGLFLVDMEDPTFLSDVQLLGVPTGYCPASDLNKKKLLKFEALRLIAKK